MFPATMSAQGARELLDEAKRVLGVRSSYALAARVGLSARVVQLYYKNDKMPRHARALFTACVENARYAVTDDGRAALLSA